jgi:hypothetical protein
MFPITEDYILQHNRRELKLFDLAGPEPRMVDPLL